MRPLFCLLVTFTLPGLALALPPFPGGLIDSTQRTVYMSTGSAVLAVDLTRGDVLWQTDQASQPLLVAGDRLYALSLARTSRAHVRAFDLTAKGEPVFESDEVRFPRWVVTQERAGHSFHCSWRQDGHHLELSWRARAGTEGGPSKLAAGLARVDLDTGKVVYLPAKPVATSPPLPPQLERLAVRWQRRVSGQLLALAVEDLPGSSSADRRERFVLHSWSEHGQKENTTRELLRGTRLVVMPGEDERLLWLRDAGAGPTEHAGHWSVHAATDGHLVARVPCIPGTRSATILGDRAYCLTAGGARATSSGAVRRPGVLHAIDLTTGKVVWKRALVAREAKIARPPR
jgi:hypothetical protein